MINNYETFDTGTISNDKILKNKNGTNFLPYKSENNKFIFFQTPKSKIIKIEKENNKIAYTIQPVDNFEEFFDFNVKMDRFNLDLISNLNNKKNDENYVSPRKLPDKIEDKYFLTYKVNLNNNNQVECKIYDDLKNEIDNYELIEVGSKVSFIIKLSGILYNDYKILPYWSIEQIKLINFDNEIKFTECMIKDDSNYFTEITPENFE